MTSTKLSGPWRPARSSARSSASEPRSLILVDRAIWTWEGRKWAHLVSDESYDELHAFAARLGIPRRAFQGDHYDIPADYRERAIQMGAEPTEPRDLVRRLRAAGLRRRQRPAGGSGT